MGFLTLKSVDARWQHAGRPKAAREGNPRMGHPMVEAD